MPFSRVFANEQPDSPETPASDGAEVRSGINLQTFDSASSWFRLFSAEFLLRASYYRSVCSGFELGNSLKIFNRSSHS